MSKGFKRFLFWFAVSFMLNMNFGVIWGIAITTVLFTVSMIFETVNDVKRSVVEKDIVENHVFFKIEHVNHQGVTMLLVYNIMTNKFVMQGTALREILSTLQDKFTDKKIYISNNDGEILPITEYLEETL